MTRPDGDAGEMDEPTPHTDAEHLVQAALTDAFHEDADAAAANALASRAVEMQSSLSAGAAPGGARARTGSVPGSLSWRLQTMIASTLGRISGRAAIGAVAGVSLMGGLAAADALPDPMQNSVAEVADVVGIDFPDPDDGNQQLDASGDSIASPTPDAIRSASSWLRPSSTAA